MAPTSTVKSSWIEAFGKLLLTIIIFSTGFTNSASAYFGGGEETSFTEAELKEFRQKGLIIELDGEERVLIGDILYPVSLPDLKILAFDGKCGRCQSYGESVQFG